MTKPASRQHGYTTSSRDTPQAPEPTYAERVRTLVYRSNVGTLSTISRKHAEWPFGSLMPYALDEKGSQYQQSGLPGLWGYIPFLLNSLLWGVVLYFLYMKFKTIKM